MSDTSDAQGQADDQGQGDEGTQEEQGQESGTQDQTYTKAQLEAIIKARVASERKKYGDYADLKTKAGKLDEMEAANLSELEKATKARDDALAKADLATQQVKQTLIRSAVISEASKQGAVDPDAVLALLKTSELEPDDEGNVTGVAEAVTKLLTSKPYLKGNRVTGDVDGGTRGNGPDTAALGAMSMEDYIKATGRSDAFKRL